jgi:small conductance mechanosensitive channel
MTWFGRDRWKTFCLFGMLSVSAAAVYAEGNSACPEGLKAVTAVDAVIPVDELELRLKPLTRCELEAESAAWLALLQDKVRDISEAEIAVKYKSQEIKKTEKVTQALEAARDAQQEADQQQAAEAVEEARKAAEEARAVEQKARQEKALREAVTTALTKTQQDEETKSSDGAVSPEAAAGQQAAEAKAQEKAALLEYLTELRAERTALIDRVNVVLAEFKVKGGDPVEYDQYVKAVSGIKVDVSDASATWATVTGWLSSAEGGLRWAVNLAQFLVLVIAFYFLSILAGKAAQKGLARAQQLSTLLRGFLVTAIRRTVLFIGLFVGLAALEINVAPVLAVIGAAGFVIAFALQNSLSNFASGILMMLYRPFDVGDAVDVGGTQGKVESMNLLSTYIKSFDNKLVIVPNNSVWGGVITNINGTDTRRVDMVFGIGYQDDIDRAQRVLEEIIGKHELVLREPEPVVRLHELGDSSVNFICRPWVKPDDYWTVYWDVTRAVKQRFDSEGISIPFPQRDVHIYQEAGNETRA